MSRRKRLSDAEWQLMMKVWREQEVLLADLRASAGSAGKAATLIARCEQKGYVSRERQEMEREIEGRQSGNFKMVVLRPRPGGAALGEEEPAPPSGFDGEALAGEVEYMIERMVGDKELLTWFHQRLGRRLEDL